MSLDGEMFINPNVAHRDQNHARAVELLRANPDCFVLLVPSEDGTPTAFASCAPIWLGLAAKLLAKAIDRTVDRLDEFYGEEDAA